MTMLETPGAVAFRSIKSRNIAGIVFLLSLAAIVAAQQPGAPARKSAPAATRPPASAPATGNATAATQGAVPATDSNAGNNAPPSTPPVVDKSNSQPSGNVGSATQPPKATDHTPQILSWLSESPKDLPLQSPIAYGALLFLLGAVGALITAFYSVGDALPGIGGDGLLEPQIAQMKAFEDAAKASSSSLLDIQLKLKDCTATTDALCVERYKFLAAQYVEEMKLYEKHLARLRDLINRNKWRIYSYGMPMYVLIGGATSMLFAHDWLQALLFGYSWASVVSTIGLKGTVSQKSTAAAQQGDQLLQQIQRLEANSTTLSSMLTLAIQQIKPAATTGGNG